MARDFDGIDTSRWGGLDLPEGADIGDQSVRERAAKDGYRIRKELLEMVKDCELSAGLTDWEEGFLDNMRRRLKSGAMLTTVQEEKLEQIWSERVGI